VNAHNIASAPLHRIQTDSRKTPDSAERRTHRRDSARLGPRPHLPAGLNGLRISEALGADIDDLDYQRGQRCTGPKLRFKHLSRGRGMAGLDGDARVETVLRDRDARVEAGGGDEDGLRRWRLA
jgi:hypothetical protein